MPSLSRLDADFSSSSHHHPQASPPLSSSIAPSPLAASHDAVTFPSSSLLSSPAKIQSLDSTVSHPENLHRLRANLDSSTTALNSFSINTLHSTANIQAHVSSEFSTTDRQSTWSPNSAAHALPASLQHLTPGGVQQDFVLFDSPHPRPRTLNRTAPSLPSGQRRHSCHKPTSPAVKDQPVAQYIEYQSLSNSQTVNQPFYASSAPSSTLSLHQEYSTSSVPLLQQFVDGSVQTAGMMNAAGMFLLDFAHMTIINPRAYTDVDLGDVAPFGDAPPVFPPAFESSGGKSSASSNFTVSPQDLLLSDPCWSAPNSAALTTLTSPSLYNGSPEFDPVATSPGFGCAAEQDINSDGWYPLFPAESNGNTDQMHNLEGSPEQPMKIMEEPTSCVRKKATDSPPSSGGRFSSVAGVNARKRDRPLPPIVGDPSDPVAMKRARNTMAARKSRQRKAQRVEELEDRIVQLEAERDHWRRIAEMRMEGP
ncbi:hypothetical protein L249_2832 [Ophiocordyceps polyrhachis-furcata BCC 54312]|uniref:Cross-pathway control protein 1 n=1 Tax=Ophiocordyceps polyrhachis-furcata BCC 54312 TaxID=1330021 RepID=A0A367LNC6_9HYPO|nr:hypothetical protein L249_2832 [Ophiocordyceps polyrhachis-furcata BCC 54312]